MKYKHKIKQNLLKHKQICKNHNRSHYILNLNFFQVLNLKIRIFTNPSYILLTALDFPNQENSTA